MCGIFSKEVSSKDVKLNTASLPSLNLCLMQ
ncbi:MULTISPECIES: YobF family protein [Erwinia]|uniref:YobF family protein n=1 Tax=Erwinia papayae TaxID=206499 RepID=A0ABV3MZZ5_9GAMM|nr:YobF family protein [Erwinia mallotivora]